MRAHRGFTLTEVLVAMLVASLVIGGVTGFFVAQKRIALQEEISAEVDNSLRIALARISDKLRDAGYGVPAADHALWIPWISGFAANPNVRDGASGTPDAIDIASCRSVSVSTLSATAAPGATTVHLNDSALVDTAAHRLINIGGIENAHVVSTASGIQIDTDPSDPTAQGLARHHVVGTSVCRIDVVSFAVDTGTERLTIDDNGGAGPLDLLDNIVDMQIDTLLPGRQYRITLTARSRAIDPDTGVPVTRSASTLVTVRN